jgi:chromosome segregation ATPase
MINELRMLAEDLHSLSATNKYSTAMSKAADEIERAYEALKKANAQAEHFEREWYLRGDRVEALEDGIRQHLEHHENGCTYLSHLVSPN